MTKKVNRKYYWQGPNKAGIGRLEGREYCVFRQGTGGWLPFYTWETLHIFPSREISESEAMEFAQSKCPGQDVAKYFGNSVPPIKTGWTDRKTPDQWIAFKENMEARLSEAFDDSKYYLLSEDEKVLARVTGAVHEYLNRDGTWVADAEVWDLVHLGHCPDLPTKNWWSFPGSAREITAEEGRKFLENLETSPLTRKQLELKDLTTSPTVQ